MSHLWYTMNMNQKESNRLAREFMDGNPNVSYEDVQRACQKERLEYLWNKASFQKEWLKPITLIPVCFYYLLLD